MTGYQIFLSDGTLLETINEKTVDIKGYTPLVLVGQGIPNYGAIVAEDLVWMLEHFAAPSPPVNATRGQIWYGIGPGNTMAASNGPFFRNSSMGWDKIITSSLTNGGLLAPGLLIDYTSTGTTILFEGNNFDTPGSKKFIPTGLLLIPNGAITVSTPPIFNLNISVPGDILNTTTLALPTNASQSVYYPLSGLLTFSNGGNPINMDITTAATGGLCSLETFIFGFVI
jgi:hypothetical protein